MTAGRRTPGKNGFGIRKPNSSTSQAGKMRSPPSSHPTYQSGWAGELTASGMNGP